MARSASLLNPKSEFDSFLFASVGEDQKGTTISVLTAFARLGFEPWQKAADLAMLPKELAKTKLAAILAALPGMSPAGSESGTVAARLISLLPVGQRAGPGSQASGPGAGGSINLGSPRALLIVMLFMALAFAAQVFMGSLVSPTAVDPQARPSTSTSAEAPAADDAPPAAVSIATDDEVTSEAKQAQGSGAGLATRPDPGTAPVRKPLFGK